MNFETLWGVVI